ncbi:unnamed protein product [Fraxinus pennsylvanica]|uniref:Glycolipid transfer protein domain-containing protein n=1 Tax=Fraxinus pennsylvanica TaxID=56036 RepID=A0AAD2AHC7_9LAMI|nr:unnamed protein product [Fraxinus pennsylvanica]
MPQFDSSQCNYITLSNSCLFSSHMVELLFKDSCPTTRVSRNEEDSFEDAGAELTPLSTVADAFEELSALVKSKDCNFDLRLKPFCDACSLVSVLFTSLGIAFKFAELEYVSKLFSFKFSMYKILQSSLSLFEPKSNFPFQDCCLREAASIAYAETCAPYHTWAVRTAAGMYALPTREQLLLGLNESDDSAEKEMQRYINASLPIIQYIDKLYTSRNIGLDWSLHMFFMLSLSRSVNVDGHGCFCLVVSKPP